GEDRRGAGDLAPLRPDQGRAGPALARHVQGRRPHALPPARRAPLIAPRTAPPTEVLVVLPTYNEKQNLERVVAGVRKLGHDVMVVDDASPDGTGEIADTLAAADAGVRVLHRAGKLGLGSAYEDAFRIGLREGSQLFVEMDADGSHRPEDLAAIVEAARR